MKKIFAMLLFVLSLEVVSANIIVNELMPNPVADETLNEWIELYNGGDESVNLSEWVIGDSAENDTLAGGKYYGAGTIIPARGYALVTDDTTRIYDNLNISPDAIRLYVDDSSIGNGLGNSGDIVYLYNKTSLADFIEYNTTIKGMSLARLNDEWIFADSTPGYNNNGSGATPLDITGCDYGISIVLIKTIFENQSDFEFKLVASNINGQPANITGKAAIEDLSGNIIKTYSPWTNASITYQRTSSTYSPNLAEGGAYIIKANLTASCNDFNIPNNLDSKMIAIKGSSAYGTANSNGNSKSRLSITGISGLGSDDKAKFGDVLTVNLDIYKGASNKEVVYLWVEGKGEKISGKSKIYARNKYTSYSLAVPLQIYPNCDGNYKDGDYDIITGGLDEEDRLEIEVEGITNPICGAKASEKKQEAKKFGWNITSIPNDAFIGDNFPISVKIVSDEKEHIISLWSYVYKGSKVYSGSKDANKKIISLQRTEEIIATLNTPVKNAPSGEYSVKVVLNKDSQKTNSEIKRAIILKEKESKKVAKTNSEVQAKFMPIQKPYESNEERIKKTIPYFIIAFSIFLNAILIWRR